ncbi:MAG: glutamate formimidoyltransferase [Firmicutes bacterium]|nr:glutamate formimidoyltransferase [Bacillota bacterium]
MWLECIPNFSEGRRKDVLQAIYQAAQSTGVKILGFESDPDHNRSVLTMAGTVDAVLQAAYETACTAVGRIDLREHAGAHPRMGAVDVIPFVPLGSTPMDIAVQAAHRLGERLGHDVSLPGYYYEAAALDDRHKNLAAVRRGQFEKLAEKFPSDPPDFGPLVPHVSAGAVAIGARKPLIAFNMYLNTENIQIAQDIARHIRASSGGLAGVKALGMYLPSRQRVQISMNIVDYPLTPLPQVVEMVRREAARYGVMVERSELIGMLPAQALLDSASYYLQLPQMVSEDVVELNLAEQVMPDAPNRLEN